MVSKLLIGLCLMALSVVIHGTGLAWALQWARRKAGSAHRGRDLTWIFIALAAWMILLHLTEISAWAMVYLLLGAIADLPSAVYFSAVTYTTTGYGDIVLPQEWRLVGGIEALTGILMCGWSSGFFFAVVSRAYQARPPRAQR